MSGVSATVPDRVPAAYCCVQTRFQGGARQDFGILGYVFLRTSAAVSVSLIVHSPKGEATMAVITKFVVMIPSLAEYAGCNAHQLRMGMHALLEQDKEIRTNFIDSLAGVCHFVVRSCERLCPR